MDEIEAIKFLLAGKECKDCAWILTNKKSQLSFEVTNELREQQRAISRNELFKGEKYGCSAPGRKWEIPNVGGCGKWMCEEEKKAFLLEKRNQQIRRVVIHIS